MELNRPVPRKNSWRKHKNKLIWLFLYYGFAYWLPSSYSILGRLLYAKTIRYYICKHIFLKIGKNVNIESHVNFGSGLEIEIGNNSGMGTKTRMPSNVKIGDNVLMGPECFFLPFNHHYKEKSRLIKAQGYGEKMETRIGNDVWIGREVMFNPGMFISDGTVIAARTLVCKKFPPYSVIGGNPSRIIGSRE